MKAYFNKKGSFAVFATMLFLALIMAMWAIINAAGEIAIASSINSFGHVWSKSILGEYDIELKNRYGLLAFYDNEYSVETKLKKYMDYSLDSKPYIDYETPKCSLDEYNLSNTSTLLGQIEIVSLEETSPVIKHYEDSSNVEGRYISNPCIIECLPSYNKADKLYVVSLANKIKSGASITSLMDNASIDKYIFNFFKDYMNMRDLGKTYFNCEVEYIITGEYSDLKLKESAGSKIELLRNVLNLFYLYNCQEKRDVALALATAVTPGAMALITQGVILETWAYAEAKNDMKILYDNKAVSLLKKDCNWALALENVFAIEGEDLVTKEEQKEYVAPQNIEGESYSNYLKILLCGITKETKLLRIMDLIQINMKYIYCDFFLIKDYNCGLKYNVVVNGHNYVFEDTYV